MLHFTLRSASIDPVEGSAGPLAIVDWSNPLEGSGLALPESFPAPRLVAWSGWIGPGALPRQGLFPRTFETWSEPGWSAFETLCERLLPRLLAAGKMLCLRPHARHVLADPQSCVSFLSRREGAPFEVLLDPAGFLEPSMLPAAADHLERAFATLATHPHVPATLLTNLEHAHAAGGGEWQEGGTPDGLRPAPLHRGLLDPALLARLARRHCPPDRPVVLLDTEVEEQIEALGR